jgi:N-acetylglutamate synthase-like GNAT family acetyltransferase
MDNLKGKVELVRVTADRTENALTFLRLGRDYLSSLPADEQERFLQSILSRQKESHRWLLLLKWRNDVLGFVHMKIDRDERPGWGLILEFYIVPNRRKLGWGRRLFNLSIEILRGNGVKHIWLLSKQESESFWRSLGFRETGEVEENEKIMVASIRSIAEGKECS